MKRYRLITALICFVFLALGAALMFSARNILLAEGVTVRRVSFEGGGGKLCLPGTAQAHDVPLYEEEHGDHEESVTVGGKVPAAMVLGSGLDGTHALAVELTRRGVAVLIPDKSSDPASAWTWLTEQSFVRVSSLALIASQDRAEEALSLGADLAASDRASAAAILLGNSDTLYLAADYPGRNLLILAGREPDAEAREAYFGAGHDSRTEFTGYFGDGSARAASVTQGRDAFSSRKTLRQILDWQGSSLGHVVELPDDSEIFTLIDFCRIAAVFCLVAAGAILPLRRGGYEEGQTR